MTVAPKINRLDIYSNSTLTTLATALRAAYNAGTINEGVKVITGSDPKQNMLPKGIVDVMIFEATKSLEKNADILVITAPEVALRLSDLGYTNVTVLYTNTEVQAANMAVGIGSYLGYKVFHSEITKKGITFPMKKFDAIIGNPPYSGVAQLHQQFFNMAVESVKDGSGIVCFIQPATPYFNKKGMKPNERKMTEYVDTHESSVSILPPSTFQNAGLFTDLAITVLKKTVSNGTKIAYINGKSFHGITVKDMNVMGVAPDVYRSISNKYFAFIAKNGSLNDVVSYGPENPNGAYIQGLRGNPGTDNFYSIITTDTKYHRKNGGEKGLAVDVSEENFDNFYVYAATFIARFGLSLSKYNLHNDRGELKTVPLVPFDRNWTDEELAKLIGLTDEELSVIRSVLPDYHGLLGKETK